MSDKIDHFDTLPEQTRNTREKPESVREDIANENTLPSDHIGKSPIESSDQNKVQLTNLPQAAQELGAQFLIADFNNLREFMVESNASTNKRIDVLLTITTVFGTGLVLLSQTHMDKQAFLMLALIGSVSLCFIGLATLRLVVFRDILAVDYIRSINKIREYFAEYASHIRPFLLMPISAEVPAYGRLSDYQQIMLVVNSILVGASIVIISLLIRHVTLLDFTSLAIACISALAGYLLQTLYAKRRYNWAEANFHKRRFGYEKIPS